MTMKAYVVLETDENTGGFVFATSSVAARRIGADAFANGDFSGVTCRRAPWADQYAQDGSVPAGAAVEHGYWVHDALTDERIDLDELADRGLTTADIVGTFDGFAFMTQDNHDTYWANRAARKAAEDNAIDELWALVKARLPDATQADRAGRNWAHSYAVRQDGEWVIEQAIVSFDWPGMKIGPASCRYDKAGEQPKYYCCIGDLEEFTRWFNATSAQDGPQ